MTTVDRIFQLIKENNMTAKEFAEKVGVSSGNITDWKTGRAKPSVESLQKIAKYANVQLKWLTGDSNFKTIEEEFLNHITTQNKILILKTIDRYHSEYVIPCSLKEKDIDFLVDLFSDVNLKNVKEKKEQLKSYLDSFEPGQKKKIKELLCIIVTELQHDLENKSIFLHYNTLLTENKNQQSKNNIRFSKIPIVGKISAGQPILAQENIEGYLPVDPNVYGLSTSENLFYLRVSGESMNKKVKNGDYALIQKQDYAEDGDIIVAIINGDDEATLKRYKQLNEQFVLLEPMSTDSSIEPITVDLKNTTFKIIGKAIGQFGKF